MNTISSSITRSAPGKVILCGEHSVVYGQPALAVPVSGLRAHAAIAPAAEELRLCAADLGEVVALQAAPLDHPLAAIARLTLAYIHMPAPAATLTVRSDLPIAAGLGSGAAVSVAAARALAAYLGHPLDAAAASALAYEVEKLHHGAPSGIDNTVIAYEQPVYFIKGQPPELLRLRTTLTLLIADSGIPGVTRDVVAGVAARRAVAPAIYDAAFERIGMLVERVRALLAAGQGGAALGALLDENHTLLQTIGVSLPPLDRLVAVARAAGALGVKLTGAGGGGNIIALVTSETGAAVRAALLQAGARQVWQTVLGNAVDV